MSKKFKGKLCAYCVKEIATTDDHIFAREFFLVEDRNNLPKAPACNKCNNKKSRLEHYLMTVLPFGARHAQAMDNMQANVPGRLAHNQRLHRELRSGAQEAWLKDGTGIYQPAGSVRFEGEKLGELLKYVARGLAWRHWGTYVSPDHVMRVMFAPDMFSLYLQEQLRTLGEDRKVTIDLGRGTVQYAGIQAGEPPSLTFWGVSMYGGVLLSHNDSSPGGPNETSRHWWVITAPPELAAQLDGKKNYVSTPASEATPPATRA